MPTICSKVPILLYLVGPKRPSGNCYVKCFLTDRKALEILPNDFSKPYFLGIFVNWRQLAAILLAFAIPYVLGLIMVLPNDMPLPSTRKVQGKLHNGVPIHSPQKLKTSSTEKFFDISEVFNV